MGPSLTNVNHRPISRRRRRRNEDRSVFQLTTMCAYSPSTVGIAQQVRIIKSIAAAAVAAGDDDDDYERRSAP